MPATGAHVAEAVKLEAAPVHGGTTLMEKAGKSEPITCVAEQFVR
jgi:hypothetical protein